MTDRRGFLSALASLGGGLLFGRSAPRVTATATMFFSQPDGRRVLVRFVADEVDALAGRLRVFDRARRQLGTAGMIGVSGRLYGELWLPLERETEIISELESRGTRGILRTTHRLRPARKWTVYCMTAADSLNPAADQAEFMDHREFLRLAGTSRGDAVLLDRTGLLDRVPTAPLMLAGSGITWVAIPEAAAPLARVEYRDGSVVLAVALAAPGAGLGANLAETTRTVEQWLDGSGAQMGGDGEPVAFMVGKGDDPGSLAGRVAEWNSRFAFPRLVADRPADLLDKLGKRAPAAVPGALSRSSAPPATLWQRPLPEAGARHTVVFDPLVSRLGGGGLEMLASQFAFEKQQALVVNPSPFPGNGLVTLPDGTERTVKNVPALGYLCIPLASGGEASRSPAGRWLAVPGSDNDLTLDNRFFEIRVDLETGAIRSLVSRANGREWIPDGRLLNAAGAFRLDTLSKLRNEGAATRMVVSRAGPGGSRLVSTLTVYDEMPWLDIVNEQQGATVPVNYGFAFALDRPKVTWEVPAGFAEGSAPIERLVHLRWLRLASGSDTVLLRGLDAPVASVTAEGELRSTAPARSRYRIGVASGYSAPEDPWVFGWGAEAMTSVAAPGTGRGRLASFGSLVVRDQPAVCIADFRRDSASDGVLIHVQELAGTARDITLGPGVLSFRGARRLDFAGRDLGALPLLAGGGVAVPLRPHGITAVLLQGVELAAG